MPPGARPWNLSDDSTLMCWRMTAGSTFGIDDSGTAGAGSGEDAAGVPGVRGRCGGLCGCFAAAAGGGEDETRTNGKSARGGVGIEHNSMG